MPEVQEVVRPDGGDAWGSRGLGFRDLGVQGFTV